MRLLLTGATGLVGGHLLEEFLARGVEVHAVTRRDPRGARLPHADRTTWRHADLLQPGVCEALIDEIRPTHLLHAAWNMEPKRVWTDPENLAWVGASLALFRAFAEARGGRAVFIGTCAEYAWTGERCREDSTPLEPASLYGAAKCATSRAALAYARQMGVALSWARLFNLYGPNEDARRLVAGAASAFLSGRRFNATTGRQVRDFMHVSDMAYAVAELTLLDVDGPVNVASGTDVSIAELLTSLAELAERSDLLHLGALETPPGDPDRVVADVSRLRSVIPDRPLRTLRAGLEETLSWHRGVQSGLRP